MPDQSEVKREARAKPAVAASDRAPVAPLFIGPENSQAAIGRSARWCRDFAAEHGVPVIHVHRAWLIPAGPLLAAIASYGETSTETEIDAEPVDDADEVARMRARVARAG